MPDEPAPNQASRLAPLQSVGIGVGAGILNGLLGIGGGILIVPGMIFLRGLQPRAAVATSLGTVFLLSLAAFTVHVSISGLIFGWAGTLLVLAAGAAASQLGGYVLRRVTQRWILFLFAGLTLFSAVNLMVNALLPGNPAVIAAGAPPLWSYPALGAVAGFFSGVLGIGGGGLVLLGFAVLFHTPILGGLPLALLINVANAGSGVLAQLGTGHIHWRDVSRMVPSALAGIAIGTGIAVWLPADAFRIVFALFFIYMGSRLIRRGLKS